jgi:hypothetical protein
MKLIKISAKIFHIQRKELIFLPVIPFPRAFVKRMNPVVYTLDFKFYII